MMELFYSCYLSFCNLCYSHGISGTDPKFLTLGQTERVEGLKSFKLLYGVNAKGGQDQAYADTIRGSRF